MKYYISEFDIQGREGPEFIGSETFDDFNSAIEYLKKQEPIPGHEFNLGCGEGDEEYFPPHEEDDEDEDEEVVYSIPK